MIDLLFSFPFESDAAAALQPLGLWHPATEDGPGYWDTSRVLPGLRITLLDGSSPSGWWCGVTLDDIPDDLTPLTQAVLDPEKPEGLKPSEYVISTVWPLANIDAIAEISPLWAGRPYVFPGLPDISQPA